MAEQLQDQFGQMEQYKKTNKKYQPSVITSDIARDLTDNNLGELQKIERRLRGMIIE